MMNAMLCARLCDPLGPRWTRSVVPALGLALVVFGLFTPAEAATRAATVLVGVALMSWANLLRIPRATRDVTLHMVENGVSVTNAGPLSQRLGAADVRAARVLRGEGAPALALVRHSAPERPIILKFLADEDLDRVRRVLGIGYLGFGTITWPTEPTAAEVIRRIGSGVLGAGWIAMAINAALDDAAACLAVAVVLVPLTCAALMAWLVAPFPMPSVALAPHEMTLFDRIGRPAGIPYRDIVFVRVDEKERHLILETRTGERIVRRIVPLGALNAEERQHLEAQIASARRVAAGKAEPLPTFDASLSILLPRDEPKRAWLDRLDATAVSLSKREAYRRADLAIEDLWEAVENPDAATPLRAGAARVLARIAPDETKRLVRVLLTERDDEARAFLGAALDEDTEAAAQTLSRLG